MSIKESELPVASSVGSSDFVRIVTSSGDSQQALASLLPSGANGLINLDTSAATGTVDGDLYAAIVALGWENDVIV